MKLGRYGLVIALACAAGALWAWLFVDWPPRWYERSGAGVHALVLATPIAVHFLCGLAFGWWNWEAALAYSAIVGVCWGIGAERNAAIFGCVCCRGEAWVSETPAVLTRLFVSGACLVAPWALARGLKRLPASGWQPQADR